MATCHLIADTNLTLLGNVNLGLLNDTRRKVVTNGQRKLLTLQNGIELVELLQVVDNELTDELVGVLVFRPTAEFNSRVIKCCQHRTGKRSALGNEL